MKFLSKNKSNIGAVFTFILISLLLILGGRMGGIFSAVAVADQKPAAAPVPPPPPPPPPPTRVTVAAVGDLLMHIPITNAAAVSGGKYDFTPAFKFVKPYLEFPDFTIANLETKLAGEKKGYSGYPRFNTPAEFAIGAKESGIDLLGTANNHTLDMGADGLVTTLDNLDAASMPHVGTSRTKEESKKIFITDLKGIKLAVLNYTAMTNGLSLPADKKFMADILYPAQASADAQAAKHEGADIVMAFVHWDSEYRREPAPETRATAKAMCEGGVDFIIGSHPHVVQPIERIKVQRAGKPYSCLVVYSLGNFISNQRERYRDSGIIAYVDLEKDQKKISVLGVRYLPTYVQIGYADGKTQYRVLPVHPDIKPESDIQIDAADQNRMKQIWEERQPFLNKPQQDILPLSVKALKVQQ